MKPFLPIALAITAVLTGCGSPPPSNVSDTAPSGSGGDIASTSAEIITDGSAGSTQTYQNVPQEIVPIEDRDMGDTLVLRLRAEPPHLNILLDTADAGASYIANGFIFEPLMMVNDDTLEWEPFIAKSWEISDDHLTYTFQLRDDVTFSDGVPLTAHDIKFTFDITMKPEVEAFQRKASLEDIDTVTVLDDYTIQYKMKKPFFRHLLILALGEIYPKHIYEKGDFNHHERNRSPIGSGPYLFEKWDTGQQIVITRNENYWGEKQPLKKRIWKIITDDNAAFQALERGDVDMNDIPPDDWNRKASTDAFEKKFNKYTPDSPIPGLFSRYNYVGWNMRKPQFQDKRVRQALAMLFDTQLIIDTVWGGLGTRITGGIYHKAPEYDRTVLPLPFDPEAAAKLLDEAGWIDTDGDGIRDKDGIKFEFELGFAASVAEYERLGTVYQEELKRAGIDMRLGPLEWATFSERVHNRNFDACMLAWLTPIMADPYPLWHSSQAESGVNYSGLQNAELDKILENIRLEFDREKRIVLYKEAQAIIYGEQPYLFLYARPGLQAFDKRIHGTIEHTGGFNPLDWWVPAHQQKYP
ncbi:MAG: peptide-binding protein [Candidatus Hydrogenedentota bacterium]